MDSNTEAVLLAIRKIIRASDIHSNYIRRSSGLTSPQLLLLKAMRDHPDDSVGKLSEHICLSQATVTTILDRLEAEGLASRRRSAIDKRKVHAQLTDKGHQALKVAPSPLQVHFVEQFEALRPYEQTAMLSALQHVADMMQSPLPANTNAIEASAMNKAL